MGHSRPVTGLLYLTMGKYDSSDPIIKNEMGGACGVLMGVSERKRPLGRPRRRWEDNIKINSEEMGQKGMNWIDLAQDRDRCPVLAIVVMNFWVP